MVVFGCLSRSACVCLHLPAFIYLGDSHTSRRRQRNKFSSIILLLSCLRRNQTMTRGNTKRTSSIIIFHSSNHRERPDSLMAGTAGEGD